MADLSAWRYADFENFDFRNRQGANGLVTVCASQLNNFYTKYFVRAELMNAMLTSSDCVIQKIRKLDRVFQDVPCSYQGLASSHSECVCFVLWPFWPADPHAKMSPEWGSLEIGTLQTLIFHSIGAYLKKYFPQLSGCPAIVYTRSVSKLWSKL